MADLKDSNFRPKMDRQEGIVNEALPGLSFRVTLIQSNQMVLAHLAGKLKLYHIRILPGDHVQVELSPYDLTKGRITYRL